MTYQSGLKFVAAKIGKYNGLIPEAVFM